MNINESIKQQFNKKYKHWDLRIEDSILIKEDLYELRDKGWNIRFKVAFEDEAPFIEVYACHRMTSDAHYLIDRNGRIEVLDAIVDMFAYNPQIENDEELQRKAFLMRNKKIYNDLMEKELMSHS